MVFPHVAAAATFLLTTGFMTRFIYVGQVVFVAWANAITQYAARAWDSLHTVDDAMVRALYASFAPAPVPAPIVERTFDYGAVLGALAHNNNTTGLEAVLAALATAPSAPPPPLAQPWSYLSGVWNGAQLVLFAGAAHLILRSKPPPV